MNTILIKHLDLAHKIQAERLGYREGNGIRIIALVSDKEKVDEYEVVVSNFYWQRIKEALKEAKEWEYWPVSNCWTNRKNKPLEKELERIL